MTEPTYYAIIPASVRYDKNLCMGSRMLYGEITALCNATGECWASNMYFAKLYSKSDRTIKAWIEKLRDRGYITTKMHYKDGSKEVEKRSIFITSQCQQISPPSEENFTGPGEENFTGPGEENFTDNNTSINNTSINNICAETKQKKSKPSDDELNIFFESVWKLYPKKLGKDRIKRSKKLELYKIGYEELARAIQRYIDYLVLPDNKRWLKHGSTFFGDDYKDYLDDRWKEVTDADSGENTGIDGGNRVSTRPKISTGTEIVQRLYETGQLQETSDTNGPFV